MRLDSVHAKPKLLTIALLLGLFALPFGLHWRTITATNSQAVLAGGTMVGGAAATLPVPAASSNNVQASVTAAGSSFAGALSQATP